MNQAAKRLSIIALQILQYRYDKSSQQQADSALQQCKQAKLFVAPVSWIHSALGRPRQRLRQLHSKRVETLLGTMRRQL